MNDDYHEKLVNSTTTDESQVKGNSPEPPSSDNSLSSIQEQFGPGYSQQLQTIFDLAVDAILIGANDGTIIQANHQATVISKYELSELIGSNISILFSPEEQKRVPLAYDKLNAGEIVRNERMLLCKDKSLVAIEMNTRMMPDKSYQTIIRDVTERKQNELALIAAKEKAEQSEKLKSVFLANMSHEIRSPLNSIVGFSELLEDEDLTAEQRRDFIAIIVNSGKHLLTIINDIIDFAKIDSNQLTISNSDIHLNHLLDDIMMATEVEKKKLSKNGIKLSLIKSFPDQNCMIHCDEVRLKQILLNLTGNALKFTEQGTIQVGYRNEGDNLLFYVKDTGKGIAQDKLKLIFERFRQEEESTTRVYGGTGLGLSISKGLIELLGGQIWVESEPGKGSTFFFTMPISIWTGLQESKAAPVKEISEFDFTDRTIVVAEDVASNFRLLNYMLSRTNAKVLYAENGREALELCLKEPKVDMVLMDIQMPVMDGYEATAEIRKILPNLPIIALTAFSFEDDAAKCLECGCNDYLTKPIEKSAMLSMVQKLMQN